MSERLTSNQINDRLLDACLDAECFRLVWAYIKFGGWEEDRGVFLSTEFIKRWGMNKSTVKRHRKHLIERGILVTTGKKSLADFDIYLVRIPLQPGPQVQDGPPDGSMCTTPTLDMGRPSVQADPAVRPDRPTEVTTTNRRSRETSKEPVEEKRVVDALSRSDDSTSEPLVTTDRHSSSPLEEVAPDADAPGPASSGQPRTTEGILRGILVNPKSFVVTKSSRRGSPPVAADPAEPTEAEIQETMAWLRDYAPTYREMKRQDLRAAAEGRLRLPARQAEQRRRLEIQERMGRAREAAKADREMDLTW